MYFFGKERKVGVNFYGKENWEGNYCLVIFLYYRFYSFIRNRIKFLIVLEDIVGIGTDWRRCSKFLGFLYFFIVMNYKNVFFYN